MRQRHTVPWVGLQVLSRFHSKKSSSSSWHSQHRRRPGTKPPAGSSTARRLCLNSDAGEVGSTAGCFRLEAWLSTLVQAGGAGTTTAAKAGGSGCDKNEQKGRTRTRTVPKGVSEWCACAGAKSALRGRRPAKTLRRVFMTIVTAVQRLQFPRCLRQPRLPGPRTVDVMMRADTQGTRAMRSACWFQSTRPASLEQSADSESLRVAWARRWSGVVS